MADSKSGYIYFVKAKNAKPVRYQIGLTRQLPEERIQQLNREYDNYSIELIRAVYVKDCSAAEKELQAKYRHKILDKQWFSFSKFEVGKIEQQMLNISYGKPPASDFVKYLIPVGLGLLAWAGIQVYDQVITKPAPTSITRR